MARLLWTQRQDFGPAFRSGHALAFDTNRSRVVLFGGNAQVPGTTPGTALADDTWEWDGDNWTQVNDIGPSPRHMLAMAFDRKRNRLVLFGGLTGSAGMGDTWEWDGQDWTQVSETGPKARILHAMVFDSSKNVVTLYGGQLQEGDPAHESSYLNDTWDWDGFDWTQQEDTGPNRCAHAMAYDDSRKRLVLFGGSDAGAQQYGDTWEWDGTSWTQRSVFGPPATIGGQLVFTGDECILFGGTHGNQLQNQTWSWDGTHWTARQDMGPAPRTAHGLAFDSVRQKLVLFAGLIQPASGPRAPAGDTWEQNIGAPTTGTGPSTSVRITSLVASAVSESGFGTATTTVAIQLSGPAPTPLAILFTCSAANSGVSPHSHAIGAGQSLLTGLTIHISHSGAMLPAGTTLSATLQGGNTLVSNPLA
jgi:hypothetical protein